jgi:hypothetical protein
MHDKRPQTVFNALQEWARHQGPKAGFTLADLDQVHGDFDSTFRSRKFIKLTGEAGVRITYEAPNATMLNYSMLASRIVERNDRASVISRRGSGDVRRSDMIPWKMIEKFDNGDRKLHLYLANRLVNQLRQCRMIIPGPVSFPKL